MKTNYSVVLTLTPKRNIEGGHILDSTKIRVERYGWNEVIKVFNWCTLLADNIAANRVSVEDHYITLENEDWKIISFFSGPEDVCGEDGTYYNARKKELGLSYKEIDRNRPFGKAIYA